MKIHDNNKDPNYNNATKAVGEPKSENTIVLSKETTKRLLKDVRELIKHPLDSDGIYYKHDESNILKGYVYICGPKDSQCISVEIIFSKLLFHMIIHTSHPR